MKETLLYGCKIGEPNYMKQRKIYVDIELKLISKIAHYRLNIRTQFRNRHNVMCPELTYKTIMGDVSNLKVWLRMAELIEPMNNR